MSGFSSNRALANYVHVQSNLRCPSQSAEVIVESSSSSSFGSSSDINPSVVSNNVIPEGEVDSGVVAIIPSVDIDEIVYNALALAIELHEVQGFTQSDSASQAKISRFMLKRYCIPELLLVYCTIIS